MAELRLQANTENLEQVMGFVEEQLAHTGCDTKALMQVQMAVEEIYVNIANYAYSPSAGMATVRVEVEKQAELEQAVITFIDRGVPYNPLEREDPDVSLSAEERPVGGLGIYMVKKSVDSVEYKHKDGENVLILRKRL